MANLSFHWQIDEGEGDLSDQLLEDVSRARHLDIAVAWMTPGRLLDKIEKVAKHGADVKVRVGLWGFNTHPQALRRLLDALAKSEGAKVWNTEDSQLFHPKVYWIRTPTSAVVWAGSPNGTGAAFDENCEAAIRVSSPLNSMRQSVRRFFYEVDLHCRPLTTPIIDDYAKKWKKAKVQREKMEKQHQKKLQATAEVTPVMTTALGLASWKQYYASLREHASRRAKGYYWADALAYYLHTIEEVGPLLAKGNVRNLEACDKVLGKMVDNDEWPDYGHLGSMRASGKLVDAFRRNRNGLRSRVLAICRKKANWKDVEHALKAAEKIESFQYCASGFATRIGALMRPDLMVSVNGASAERLANWSGIPASRIKTMRGYAELIRWVHGSTWFNTRPAGKAGSNERRCWKTRCALLDVVMYDKGPEPAKGLLEKEK